MRDKPCGSLDGLVEQKLGRLYSSGRRTKKLMSKYWYLHLRSYVFSEKKMHEVPSSMSYNRTGVLAQHTLAVRIVAVVSCLVQGPA